MDLQQFCKEFPKVELHAHLNGSLSDNTLKTLHLLNGGSSGSGDSTWSKWGAIIEHGQQRTLEECFQLFNVAHSLTTSPAAVYKATFDVISEFAQDGVIYLELRSTPREVSGVMSKIQYIEAIIRAISECASNNRIIVKLLVSIDRRHGRSIAEETFQLVLEARKQYPDIVLGLDLSGDPTKGNIEDYLPLLNQARHAGLKIAVHCAEVPNEAEVKKILLFKPDRIGHATCIHPQQEGSEELWKILIESRIPIELCLTSNVKCKTVESYDKHQLRHFYSCQHPVVLGTDDKGVFNTSLSEEYYLAAKVFHFSREQLWQLSLASVDYTFTSEKEKVCLREIFTEWKMKNWVE